MRDERGAAAVLVASALVFLFGAAALAIDVSGFYGDARTDQTTADLSCLAGVVESTDAARIAMAAEFTKQNWSTMAGQTVSVVGSTGFISDGTSQVVFEPSYLGDADKMRVRVLEVAETSFAAVLGADSVNVLQEAVCEASDTGAGGTLPFGAITGGWTGPLQINPPCGPSNGNCGALYIARDDANGSGPTIIANIARGSDRRLQAWFGNGSGSVECDAVSSGDICHVVETDTGVSASHLGEGFFQRLDGDPGASCTFTYKGGTLNCDTPTQVLGASWTPLMAAFPSAPAWWDTRLYGTYDVTNTNRHYWYDGVVAKCDSPRLAGIPIVTEDLDWDLGDAHTAWPSGNKDMKIVGLLDVIVEEPYDAGDFSGNKNLKTAAAGVIWFGPNATCADGSPIGVLNGVPAGTSEIEVKLIAG